ncbi:MAG: oligosaccharide flippase family protein [Actinomycetia bacterium]|nr:oligosaccharide flippase family protein [Actinomycetes bacterium]
MLSLALLGIAVSRRYGPSGRGLFAAATNIGTLAAHLAAFGLAQATLYYAAKNHGNEQELGTLKDTLRRLISRRMPAAAILGLLISILVTGSWTLSFSTATLSGALLVYSIRHEYVHGLSEFRSWNHVRLTFSVGSLLFGLGALLLQSNVAVVVGGQTMAAIAALAGTRAWWKRRPKQRTRKTAHPDSVDGLTTYARRAFVGFIAQVANARIDIVVLSLVVSPSEVGNYSAAVAIAMLPMLAIDTLSATTGPRIARGTGGSSGRTLAFKTLGLGFAASLTAALLIAATAEVVVRLLYGSEFQDAISLLRVLAIASIPRAMNRLMGGVLRASGHPEWPSRAELAALCITIPGLLFLAPTYGAPAAAYISLVAYLVTLSIGMVGTKRVLTSHSIDTSSPTDL